MQRNQFSSPVAELLSCTQRAEDARHRGRLAIAFCAKNHRTHSRETPFARAFVLCPVRRSRGFTERPMFTPCVIASTIA